MFRHIADVQTKSLNNWSRFIHHAAHNDGRDVHIPGWENILGYICWNATPLWSRNDPWRFKYKVGAAAGGHVCLYYFYKIYHMRKYFIVLHLKNVWVYVTHTHECANFIHVIIEQYNPDTCWYHINTLCMPLLRQLDFIVLRSLSVIRKWRVCVHSRRWLHDEWECSIINSHGLDKLTFFLFENIRFQGHGNIFHRDSQRRIFILLKTNIPST